MTNFTNKFARLTEGTRNWVAAEAGRFLDAFARQDWATADVAYGNVTTYIPLGGSQPETELAWEFLAAIAA
jgi:hypothetical protein